MKATARIKKKLQQRAENKPGEEDAARVDRSERGRRRPDAVTERRARVGVQAGIGRVALLGSANGLKLVRANLNGIGNLRRLTEIVHGAHSAEGIAAHRRAAVGRAEGVEHVQGFQRLGRVLANWCGALGTARIENPRDCAGL